jgi:signal peptidase I
VKLYLSTQPDKPQRLEEGAGLPPAMWWVEPTSRGALRFGLKPTVKIAGPSPAGYWRQLLMVLLFAILSTISYLVVSRFIVTAVIVQGKSMAPTLADGDECLLNRLAYLRHPPSRGDLVVLKDPGHKDCAVKRIIALPCEAVHLKQGAIYVNGKRLFEPYLSAGTRTLSSDAQDHFFVVGKDEYFVMGDNRANSEDSRCYGPVHRDWIVGALAR